MVNKYLLFMGKKKELNAGLRLNIVTARKEGKGYKAISKQFIVPVATVQSINKKYKKFYTIKAGNHNIKANTPANVVQGEFPWMQTMENSTPEQWRSVTFSTGYSSTGCGWVWLVNVP